MKDDVRLLHARSTELAAGTQEAAWRLVAEAPVGAVAELSDDDLQARKSLEESSGLVLHAVSSD